MKPIKRSKMMPEDTFSILKEHKLGKARNETEKDN